MAAGPYISLATVFAMVDKIPNICVRWAPVRGGFDGFFFFCCSTAYFHKYCLALHTDWIWNSVQRSDHYTITSKLDIRKARQASDDILKFRKLQFTIIVQLFIKKKVETP